MPFVSSSLVLTTASNRPWSYSSKIMASRTVSFSISQTLYVFELIWLFTTHFNRLEWPRCNVQSHPESPTSIRNRPTTSWRWSCIPQAMGFDFSLVGWSALQLWVLVARESDSWTFFPRYHPVSRLPMDVYQLLSWRLWRSVCSFSLFSVDY